MNRDRISSLHIFRWAAACAVLTGGTAFAFWRFHRPYEYESDDPSVRKMVSVIKNDRRCDFATVERARPNAPASEKEAIAAGIYSFRCIGDIVVNSGTLAEQSGCGAFVLNGNTLETSPIASDFELNIVTNTSCASGGFKKLVKMKLLDDFTVGNALLHTSDFAAETIVLYASNPIYIRWYRTAKINEEVNTIKRLEQRGQQNDWPEYSDDLSKLPLLVGGGPLMGPHPVYYKKIISGDPLLGPSEKKEIAKLVAVNQTKNRSVASGSN